MKKLLYCFFACIFSISTFAQEGSLKGLVTDDKSAPLHLVSVALLKSDSSQVSSGLTDKEGKFSIPVPAAGSYFIRFSSIGFTHQFTPVFMVDGPAFTKDFGTITMTPRAQSMNNVTVTALRPQIVQKADRMVVGVEGTALAAGSTAFDVLSRSPGVFVDQEGNIQLNGKSGVTVMIDNKLTYLSARELRVYLESMPAENIKNIEIITNPSARYDAEGSSGILNINLKKNEIRGMNGSVYSNYYYNKQHGYSAGGNINYKSGKWNSFLNVDFNRRVGGREATFTRIFYGSQETIYFDQVATAEWNLIGPPSIRVGADYSFNKMHSIGVMGNLNKNTFTTDFLTDTYIGNEPSKPYSYIDANNYTTNKHRNYNGNIHYVGKLDTTGTLLSADFDFVTIRNYNESEFLNYFTELPANQKTQDFLYTYIPSGYDILSGKIDFTKPFTADMKLDMGVKASRVVSDNDARFYFNNGGLVPDPSRSNHFNYNERIYAAYVNMNAKLSKVFSVQAGLRAENTVSTGNLITTGQVTERNFLDFFPSIFLQNNLSENYQVNINYSRRLARPNYGNLNPFISYRDPYTWFQGNPYLRPQYTNSYGITQTFKKSYNLIFNYQQMKDVISELPKLDVNNATTTYYTGNVNTGSNISLTAIIPVKFISKWESSNTFVLAHHKYDMEQDNMQLNNEQLFWMIQSNHTILLPKDLKIELNSGYRGPAAYGLYHIAPQWWVHLGFKKSFLNKKLDVTISANDIFRSQRLVFTTDIDGNVNDFDQYFFNQNIGFTIRYNFSKGLKIDESTRNRNLEELNRTN